MVPARLENLVVKATIRKGGSFLERGKGRCRAQESTFTWKAQAQSQLKIDSRVGQHIGATSSGYLEVKKKGGGDFKTPTRR